jgi:hypothetical protein
LHGDDDDTVDIGGGVGSGSDGKGAARGVVAAAAEKSLRGGAYVAAMHLFALADAHTRVATLLTQRLSRLASRLCVFFFSFFSSHHV